MAVVSRRTFYGKVGQADAIVKLLQEVRKMFAKHGVKLNYRILTDNNSGRTDRVVWEWEAGSREAVEAVEQKAMTTVAARKEFGAWFGKLSELITHAEVDSFSIR